MKYLCKLVPLLFLLTALGCNSTSPGKGSADQTQPTPEDRLLARQFEELTSTMPGQRAQEIMNLFNETDPAAMRWAGFTTTNNTGPMALLRLKGILPTTPDQLTQGRGVLKMMVEKLEMARTNLPPAISVARCQGGLTLDGTLDESAWQSATVVPIPVCFRPWKARPGPPSTVRLLWDTEYLYAGFDIVDRDISARPFTRDDESFVWDAAEVFLIGDLNLGLYWEICLTPTGGITDRWFYKFPRNWSGHCTLGRNITGLKRAIRLRGTANDPKDTDEGYTLEVAIPFAEVPGVRTPAAAGTTIQGLFAVSDLTGQAVVANVEYYSHVFTPVGFQDIWSFSTLTLMK